MTLPKGWKRVAIGDIAAFVTSGSRGWSRYESQSGARFFGVGDLPKDGTRINAQASRYVSPPLNSGEVERTKVKLGDILISITADLGRIGFVADHLGDSGFVNQHLALVRISSKNAEPAFIAHVLSGRDQRVRLLRLNDSSAKSGLNLETIRNFDFPLPPLPEQRRIASVLNLWEEAIEQTEALVNAKKRRFADVRTHLIEAHQAAAAAESWKSMELGDLTEELKERNSGGLTSDRVMGVLKGEGLVPMRSHVMASDISRYLAVPAQAFAYNPMRLNIGSIAKSEHADTVLVSPDYVVFRCRKGKADPDFIRFFVGTKRWRDHLTRVASGSVRTRVYYDGLRQMMLRVPGFNEQQRIGRILKELEVDLLITSTILEALQRQKRGLLRNLLSGAFRVHEDLVGAHPSVLVESAR